jgi:hypothetical protein
LQVKDDWAMSSEEEEEEEDKSEKKTGKEFGGKL